MEAVNRTKRSDRDFLKNVLCLDSRPHPRSKEGSYGSQEVRSLALDELADFYAISNAEATQERGCAMPRKCHPSHQEGNRRTNLPRPPVVSSKPDGRVARAFPELGVRGASPSVAARPRDAMGYERKIGLPVQGVYGWREGPGASLV